MHKFNYLQPLNNDNDLLAAEILLADDFPTYDVTFKQIVADFSPNIAAVRHGLESTGTKIKTTTTQRTRRSSRYFKISVISNEDIIELKSVAVNKNTSCSTKQ